jgi:hypothetical protein
VADRIDELAAAFMRLPGAFLDRGPDHPRAPDAARLQEVEAYFQLYPFLLADGGYAAFVRRYLWAGTEGDNVGIHIFAPVSEVYDPYGGEPVDEDGFFVFATSEYRLVDRAGDFGLAFGFDASGRRNQGVYRSARLGLREIAPWSWYCPSFAEWLGWAIEQRGQLHD